MTSIAELHAIHAATVRLAHHCTEEMPDLPDSVTARVIELEILAGRTYRLADEASKRAAEERAARADELARERAELIRRGRW